MKIAKSRAWTLAEVEGAVAALKEQPGLWGELERLEKENGDFLESDAGSQSADSISPLPVGQRSICAANRVRGRSVSGGSTRTTATSVASPGSRQ